MRTLRDGRVGRSPTRQRRTGQHNHAPAREIGPSLGRFEYVELTYDSVRFNEGETLAFWHAGLGDWLLTNLAGEAASEAYGDLTIAAATD